MAFPTTSVLDDFNRADGPLTAPWTRPFWDESGELSVISNEVGATANFRANYWSTSFGPDCECYLTLPTMTGTTQIFVRAKDPGPTTLDCYLAQYDDVGPEVRFYRIDNNVATQLGATITQSIANGDSFGLEGIGSSLTAYRKTGGTWSSVGSRSDATYSADGFIGLYLSSVSTRGDDFGGGTIVVPVVGEIGSFPTARIRSRRTSW